MVQSLHLEDGILGEHIAERAPIRGIQANAIVPPRMPNGFEVFQACNTRHRVVDLVTSLTFPNILKWNVNYSEDSDPI